MKLFAIIAIAAAFSYIIWIPIRIHDDGTKERRNQEEIAVYSNNWGGSGSRELVSISATNNEPGWEVYGLWFAVIPVVVTFLQLRTAFRKSPINHNKSTQNEDHTATIQPLVIDRAILLQQHHTGTGNGRLSTIPR